MSFNTTYTLNSELITPNFVPVHIKSYPLGVDVEIKPASINQGVWQIFPDSAGYVLNGKNIIVYGHNKNNVLGPIRWIKNGSQIELLNSNGEIKIYEVVHTDTVKPDNLTFIENSNVDILTMYTCTGILDLERFVVVAIPVPNP